MDVSLVFSSFTTLSTFIRLCRACVGRAAQSSLKHPPDPLSASQGLQGNALCATQKLKELITVCGGKCLDKPWNIASPQNAFTIFMPHSTDFDAARRYEASMDGVPVLTADWVLDSVAEFRVLPLEPYRVRQKHSFG